MPAEGSELLALRFIHKASVVEVSGTVRNHLKRRFFVFVAIDDMIVLRTEIYWIREFLVLPGVKTLPNILHRTLFDLWFVEHAIYEVMFESVNVDTWLIPQKLHLTFEDLVMGGEFDCSLSKHFESASLTFVAVIEADLSRLRAVWLVDIEVEYLFVTTLCHTGQLVKC